MIGEIKGTVLRHRKKFIIASIFIIIGLICFISYTYAAINPVKSVIITSENTSYEDKEPGSWQVTKSAEWTAKGEATVTFDVDTVSKVNNQYTDIILVLDVSGSMTENKLSKVKSDSTDLINTVLSDNNNRIALITFNSKSSILLKLTNDKEALINQINNLEATGGTNYYQALVNVGTLLQDYTKENDRKMIVLFLTDGYPNGDTPNQIAQYQYLKQQYPYITINGIQYEMSNTILNPIKEISDKQFLADMDTLNNVLFDASIVPVTYENYQIIDYIENDYFDLEDKNDITVSQGEVELEEEGGKQKITWTIDKFDSGSEANLSMKLKLKDEYLGQGGIYPTNSSEQIISKMDDTPDEDITSNLTPILADNYKVIYDGNAPKECTVKNIPETETPSVFDTVAISEEEPSCDGYSFKGWEIVTEDVTKINNDYFIMPGSNVTIRANWSKVELEKTMNGEVYNAPLLYNLISEQAVMDNIASEYVTSDSGVDFDKISSDTNGKGVYTRAGTEDDEYPIYYYRGDIDNNHVKFADFCWQIVRTTETGGVKLIYNGKPDANGYCNNTGTNSQIGVSAFNSSHNSIAYVGYMYGTTPQPQSRVMGSDLEGLIYGNDVEWNGRYYTLIDTYTGKGWSKDYITLSKRYHYTCDSADNTCTNVNYYYSYGTNTSYYLTLSNGDDIEDVKNAMFTNTNDSTIKITIDNWYEDNMTKYTNYLEDTIWCNDRKFSSGPLTSKDIGNINSSIFRGYSDSDPSLECSSINDSFTVSNTNGNGALTYPVALLTIDESRLAGGHIYLVNENYYLSTDQPWWFISPDRITGHYIIEGLEQPNYNNNTGMVEYEYGVRPSVSLAPRITVLSGDGSSENPYEVG